MLRRVSPVRLGNAVTGIVMNLWIGAAMAFAYVPDDPWTMTASGSVSSSGTPITLTWSLVPDGTSIPGEGPSNLIDYFDDLFKASSTSSDLTQRPWFTLFEQSFNRWSELGGITFVYEPNDNGATLQSSSGVLGLRGDIRVGGAYIDGSSGTLAYTWLPNSGDMVVDTGETNFYSNPANNYRQLRNTVMHELGHAFGLLHVESSNSALLMEPYIDTSFDGPQLDDIRGIHGLYGDTNEKSNGGLGNGTSARATGLGSLSVGTALSIGGDATGNQVVLASETDFVSITNANDSDFYSFTIAGPGLLDVALTPLGGTFNQGVEGGVQSSFNASARNDLSVAVFGPNGTTLLGSANNNGAGMAESLAALELATAGQYFVRVVGAANTVQLYELDLAISQPLNVLEGDYNSDGEVDGRDFLVWQRSFSAMGIDLAADGNGDGVVNATDLAIWQENYGETGDLVSLSTVPEPSPLVEVFTSLLAFATCRPTRRKTILIAGH